MKTSASNPVIENVRRSLGRQPGQATPARPPILPARQPGDQEAELDLLLKEINAVAGVAQRMDPTRLEAALADLVQSQNIRRACLWQTPFIQELQLTDLLQRLGVEIIPAQAEKHVLATCDLGVTEVDFALPQTGTLALLSAPEKPRTVSLVPRVHLAVLRPQALRADLHQVFAEASRQPYLIFITGPSRTSDIELTLTIGVHGPQGLYVWAFA